MILKAIFEEDVFNIKSNEEIITLLDSASVYADGIFELIENACRHTHNHEGYLWIRLNRTRATSSDINNDDEKINCTQKRIELNNIFCNKINKHNNFSGINERFSHYIEFSIFDFSKRGLIDKLMKMHKQTASN